MINQTLLSQPIFQALGWALIHFIWQGALVALLYASLRVMLRRRSSDVRYAVACGALLIMLALPVAMTLVVKHALEQKSAQALEPSREATTVWKSNAKAGEMVAASEPKQGAWTATETATPAGAGVASLKNVPQRFSRLLPWLVAIWLAGVLVLSLRVLGGWVMAQRLKSWKTVPANERWVETLEQLALRLKVSRAVRLCESVVAEVPTVIGWLRPVILVPVSAFVGLSPQQIEALLAHELAHIRRHDYLVNLLQTAVETLLFYHPAVWWVSRQIRTEREHCCDDLAVAACGNVLTYARALAELEELRGGQSAMPQLAVAADGGGGSLLRRIQRLIETPASPHQRSSAWLASLVAIATIFCICVGARTTLFSREAENKHARTPGASTLQKLLFGDRSYSFVNAQAQDGEQAKDYQIVLPQIKASVTVTASVTETDESQAVTADAPVVAGVTMPTVTMPTVSVAPVIATSQTGTAAVSYAYTLQDDDEDAPSGSYIEALAALGYTNLTVDQLIEMKQHGVSPGYLRELKTLGYQLPSVETAVRLVDHGVSTGYIKKLGSLGYKNLAFEDLVEAVDHGVRPEVIEAFNAAGYNNLPMEQAVRAVDHGVGAAYIKAMSEVGFSKLTLEQLIRLRDHGVGAEFVKEIRSLGYDNLSAEQFIRLRDHGVSASFLRKARERGFNNLSLDELIKLRDADIL